jgi:DnaK suppressor protein
MTATAHSGAAALPVRPGEKRWTEREIAELRDQLASESAAMRADIARAETDIASRLGDAVGDAGDDQADVGAKTFEREHELALTHNARELLAQNERAIARIDAGTYGTCESCGDAIGKARLQAFPRATLCVACKQREERR